jgi:ubiquinone/menaquinone biosynthesis C-methylase UbiE
METNQENDYIISGGQEGKSRLNVLSDILSSYTKTLLEKDGPISGKTFLDVGCGGGNVSLMAARMVGETGSVTGIDFDKEIISLAQKDAVKEGIKNITFEAISAEDITYNNQFDIVYARFLLSHLKSPMQVLQNMARNAKPGGKIIVQDVHFSGHFCYPPCKAFDDYLYYYTTTAKNNDQNPEIGSSLFQLFYQAKISDIKFETIQPSFNTGAGKWMAYLTMDKIKDTVIKQGLANAEEIEEVLAELEEFTKDEQTIISLPRIFTVWGIKN